MFFKGNKNFLKSFSRVKIFIFFTHRTKHVCVSLSCENIHKEKEYFLLKCFYFFTDGKRMTELFSTGCGIIRSK